MKRPLLLLLSAVLFMGCAAVPEGSLQKTYLYGQITAVKDTQDSTLQHITIRLSDDQHLTTLVRRTKGVKVGYAAKIPILFPK